MASTGQILGAGASRAFGGFRQRRQLDNAAQGAAQLFAQLGPQGQQFAKILSQNPAQARAVLQSFGIKGLVQFYELLQRQEQQQFTRGQTERRTVVQEQGVNLRHGATQAAAKQQQFANQQRVEAGARAERGLTLSQQAGAREERRTALAERGASADIRATEQGLATTKAFFNLYNDPAATDQQIAEAGIRAGVPNISTLLKAREAGGGVGVTGLGRLQEAVGSSLFRDNDVGSIIEAAAEPDLATGLGKLRRNPQRITVPVRMPNGTVVNQDVFGVIGPDGNFTVSQIIGDPVEQNIVATPTTLPSGQAGTVFGPATGGRQVVGAPQFERVSETTAEGITTETLQNLNAPRASNVLGVSQRVATAKEREDIDSAIDIVDKLDESLQQFEAIQAQQILPATGRAAAARDVLQRGDVEFRDRALVPDIIENTVEAALNTAGRLVLNDQQRNEFARSIETTNEFALRSMTSDERLTTVDIERIKAIQPKLSDKASVFKTRARLQQRDLLTRAIRRARSRGLSVQADALQRRLDVMGGEFDSIAHARGQTQNTDEQPSRSTKAAAAGFR